MREVYKKRAATTRLWGSEDVRGFSKTEAEDSMPGGYALNSLGGASYNYSFEDPLDSMEEAEDFQTDEEQAYELDENLGEEEDTNFLKLEGLGDVDPIKVLECVQEISDQYLSDLEGDLVDLMMKGRRPVEIARILRIPECEVVRLRKNIFRKIKTVYFYQYHHNKNDFIEYAVETLELNKKQARILTMFFDYSGLRPIAEAIGTRPSNVHRSLESIRTKLEEIMKPLDKFYPFLNAFKDLKYLNLKINQVS